MLRVLRSAHSPSVHTLGRAPQYSHYLCPARPYRLHSGFFCLSETSVICTAETTPLDRPVSSDSHASLYPSQGQHTTMIVASKHPTSGARHTAMTMLGMIPMVTLVRRPGYSTPRGGDKQLRSGCCWPARPNPGIGEDPSFMQPQTPQVASYLRNLPDPMNVY